jgi:hypothetical protein
LILKSCPAKSNELSVHFLSSSDQAGFLKTEMAFPGYDYMIQNSNSKNFRGFSQLLMRAEISFAWLKVT